MTTIQSSRTVPLLEGTASETDVELGGIKSYLESLGYALKSRKTGVEELDNLWQSKTAKATGTGKPDFFLYSMNDKDMPLCVWENKGTEVPIEQALSEAKGYVDGAHQKMARQSGLPRVAAGYNGKALSVAFKAPGGAWVPLRLNGLAFADDFPAAHDLARGVRRDGNIVGPPEELDAATLRAVFEKLKVIYRSIPALKSGRRPIDFTVALLTLRLLVERKRWGSWSEQPSLAADATTLDQQVAERFKTLVSRCMSNHELKNSYGSIFHFSEQSENEGEVAFDFQKVLEGIPTGKDYFKRIFELVDLLPELHGADIDLFGEVYQAIGDDAVKKAFGEYFTGRHIISGLIPVLFARSNADAFSTGFEGHSFADIACGTGGFLTETLRFVKKRFALDEDAVSDFARESFYGYDLSASNASRARVNMYFAGDGYSAIEGDVDSLDPKTNKGPRSKKFDYILTNPPYGSSSEHRLLHEQFLARVVSLLKPSTGWGLVVMPAGTFENPRSAAARLELMRSAQVTDVISLPKHAFAPYTMQRTAIVIFKKRAIPLAAPNWEKLIETIGHEKVSYFIVDNDGFANSDKRFPTRRRDEDGRWLHDDLAPWQDSTGALRDSAVMSALIKEDFTNPSGRPAKYGRYSVSELWKETKGWEADRGSGLELLPDSFLRSGIIPIASDAFFSRAEEVLSRLENKDLSTGGGLLSDLNQLLASPIKLDVDKQTTRTIEEIFNVAKGNTNLTEAAMYEGYDPAGLLVYGGGVSAPSRRIAKNAVTSKGVSIKVFKGPAIVVSVDGSSGSMQIVKEGEFTSNHHAAVLTPKLPKEDLNLIAHQAEAALKTLASNKEGSATLTMGTLKSFKVSLPTDTNLTEKLSNTRQALSDLRSLLL